MFFAMGDDLSYGLNTLGPLCLWQCFRKIIEVLGVLAIVNICFTPLPTSGGWRNEYAKNSYHVFPWLACSEQRKRKLWKEVNSQSVLQFPSREKTCELAAWAHLCSGKSLSSKLVIFISKKCQKLEGDNIDFSSCFPAERLGRIEWGKVWEIVV